MSKTIDERVVSMQFDNKQFESNVKTTMSTLDKLKQSLNFTGASKGLEDINGAVKKCNMTPLGDAVDSVKVKFSAMEVMAVTALTNITNKAVNAGTQLVESLSVDQITAGWNKYEQKTSSIQTIMNSTGMGIDEVNEYLEKLIWFSDETSYGINDMISALATMSASGGDVKKLIPLITGVANATAFAGKSASEFSTVMRYSINQAYSAGHMMTKDWMSIENATVNSKQLIEALITAGEELGKIEEGSITIKNFRSSLADKWLDTDVMEAGFGAFSEFSDAVYEAVEAGYYDTAADAMAAMAEDGYGETGIKAFEAAQKAKTFTEAIDATKDAVSSGWMRTFEIIFGNYEKATVLWTEFTNALWDVFASGAEGRNFFLEGVMDFVTPWEALQEKLGAVKTAVEKVTAVTEDLEYFQEVVSKVWQGDYNNVGDNPDRFDLLTAAGYDPRVVQELVNLGRSHELTIEEVEAAHEKYGLVMDKSVDSTEEFNAALDNLTDKQLEEAGLTKDEIKLYRDLQKEAKRLGKSVEELANDMSAVSGRDLFLGIFKNLGNAIIGIIDGIKRSWNDFFGSLSVPRIYTLIKSINEFTQSIRFTDAETGELTETGSKFQRIFDGVVAALHIAAIAIKGPVARGFELLKKVLEALDIDLLEFLAHIGDLIVEFHDWFIENDIVTKAIDALADAIANGIKMVQEWIDAFKELESVQKFWNSFTGNVQNTAGKLATWFGELVGIVRDFVETINSMDEITFDGVLDAFVQLRTDILEHFENLPEAFRDLLVPVIDLVKTIGTTILNNLGIADQFESIKQQIQSVTEAFKSWFAGLRDADDPIQYVIDSITQGLKNLLESIKSIWSNIWAHITGTADENASEMSDSGESVGTNLVLGIVRGIWEGIKTVVMAIKTFCSTIIDTVMEMFGIHSPSVVFMTIGGFLVAGLVLGIVSSIPSVGEALSKLGSYISENFVGIVSNIGSKFSELFGTIQWSKFQNIFGALGSLIPGMKIFTTISNFSRLFGALGTSISSGAAVAADATKDAATAIGNGFEKVFEVIKNVISGIVSFLKDHFDSIAVIIGGIATALGAIKLSNAIVSFSNVLSAIPKGLKSMFESFGEARTIKAKSKLILSYAIAIGILAVAMGYMSRLSWAEIGKGAAVIAVLAVVLGGLTVALNKLTGIKKSDMDKKGILDIFNTQAKNMRALALMMIGLAAAVAILAHALKTVDSCNPENILLKMSIIGLMLVGVAALARVMGNIEYKSMSKGTLTVLAVAAAVFLLVLALSKIDALTLKDPIKTIGTLVAMIAGLALVSTACGKVKGGSAVGLIGMVLSLYLLIGLLKKLDSMNFEEIDRGLTLLAGVLVAFAGVMLVINLVDEDADIKQARKALTNIGIALLLTAVAIKILAGIDQSALTAAMKVITWLGIIFAGLIYVSKYAGKDAAKAGTMLIMAAAAILLLSAAIGVLSRIENTKGLYQALSVVTVLMLLFALLVRASKDVEKAQGSLTAMAVTIGILIAAVALMTILAKNPATLWQAVAAITVIMLALALVVKSMTDVKAGSGSAAAAAVKMLGLMGIILVLALAVCELAKIPDPKNALYAAGALAAVLLALGVAVKCMSQVSIMSDSEFLTMVSLVVTMLVVVVVLGHILKELGGLDPTTALTTAVALGVVLNAMASACLILSHNKNAFSKNTILLVGMMGIVILAIAAALIMVDGINPVGAMANAVALSAVVNAIASACLILSYHKGSFTQNMMKIVAVMTGVIIGIGLALKYLDGINPVGAMANATALSIVINALASACLILSYNKKAFSKDMYTAAYNMAAVLAIIAIILGVMGALDVQANIANAIALSIMLNALAAACVILSHASDFAPGALKAAYAMSGVLFIIAIILGVMAALDIQASIGNAVALSIMLLALSFSCAILSGVKSVSAGALVSVAILGLIMLELGWVLSKILEMNIGPCLGTVITISALLLAMSIVTAILALIGPSALSAIPAAVGLMGVIVVIGAIALAIGGLMSLIPAELIEKWKVSLQSFMDFIVILATGLGEAIGGLVGGVLTGVGQGLSDFATSLQGFFDVMSSIDPMVLVGVAILAEAISRLTKSGLLESVAGLFGLEGMSGLGESMASFGESMKAFAASVADLTEEDLEHIRLAAEAGLAMADMESSVTKMGGLLQGLLGTSDMQTFGERMAAFGESMKTFSGSVSELTKDDLQHIIDAAAAGTAMADMESSVTKIGGWWQDVIGTSNMEDFGTRMEAFGESMVKFSDSVDDLSPEALTHIENAAKAGTAMADMESSTTAIGGWWDKVFGEKNAEAFGSRMEAFGQSLVKFADSVASLSSTAEDDIKNSKAATEALVEVAGVIPEEDSWWDDLTGNSTDPGAFGDTMAQFVGGLVTYATAAANLSDSAADDIKGTKTAVEALKEIAHVINGTGLGNSAVGNLDKITPLGTNMVSLINSIKTYEEAVGEGIDTEAITSSKSAVEALKEIAAVINGKGWGNGTGVGNITNIAAFGTQMASLADSLKDYSGKVSEGIDVTAIENSKTAIVAMADAAKALPNEGGIVSWFSGDNNNFAGFGAGMVTLAGHVKDYAYAVAGIHKYVGSIIMSGTAIDAMATAAKKLPNEGGLVSLFTGENNCYATFGSGMVELAKHLKTYAITVAGITQKHVDAIDMSGEAIASMSRAAKKLPNDGGVAGFFAGNNNDYSGFADGMVDIANGIKDYLLAIAGITGESLGLIGLSGKCVSALVGVSMRLQLLGDAETVDISVATTNLLTVASALNEYISYVSGITDESVTAIINSGTAISELANVASSATQLNAFESAISDAAIGQLKKLIDLVSGMGGVDFAPMGVFAQSLNELGNAGVQQFISAFTGSYDKVVAAGEGMIDALSSGVESRTDLVIASVSIVTGYMVNAFDDSISLFITSGVKIMTGFSSGIETGGATVDDSVRSVISNSASVIEGYFSEWYDAGKYLVGGFASGITANMFMARAAAVTMAKAALDAAKAVLKINSPSREFMALGGGVPEGLAKGITDNAHLASNAVKNMSLNTLDTAKNVLSQVGNYIDAGIIDTTPTITPVLDLSEVTSGAEAIGKTLSKSTTVTVKSGDSLSKIASQYGTTWQKIYEANKDVVGDNPNLIYPGQVLKIEGAVSDLSETISSETGLLSNTLSMFGVSTDGLSSAIGSLSISTDWLSSSMNNQNDASNSDIVSAIGDLQDSLGNVGNTTYSINGISVSDDSTTANALKRIAREYTVNSRK